MSDPPPSNQPAPRPWWTGARPTWKSPWELDDDLPPPAAVPKVEQPEPRPGPEQKAEPAATPEPGTPPQAATAAPAAPAAEPPASPSTSSPMIPEIKPVPMTSTAVAVTAESAATHGTSTPPPPPSAATMVPAPVPPVPLPPAQIIKKPTPDPLPPATEPAAVTAPTATPAPSGPAKHTVTAAVQLAASPAPSRTEIHPASGSIPTDGPAATGWESDVLEMPRDFQRPPNIRRKRKDRKPQSGVNRPSARPGSPWSFAAVFGTVVLLLTYLSWLYLSDLHHLEDDDLRLPPPSELPATIHAPQRLRAFLNSLDPDLPMDLLNQSTWEWSTADLASFLLKNARALDNLKDLLEEPDLQWHPRHPAWYEQDLGAHNAWKPALVLKQAEITYNKRNQAESAAFNAALDLAELSRRLRDVLVWPNLQVQALEIHRRCMESLAILLQNTTLSSDLLAQYQRDLDVCEPDDAFMSDSLFPAIYLHEKRLLRGPLPGEPAEMYPASAAVGNPKGLFFRTNKTLDLIANRIRYLSREVGKVSASSAALKDIWQDRPQQSRFGQLKPNGLGIVYAEERTDQYLNLPARQQLARTRHLLIRQLLAVRRFIATNKGLPETLKDLIPNYLPRLPMDPFSGKPFLYDLKSGLIYSVGSDMQSAGGEGRRAPLSDPGEPTVFIGVRPAQAVPQ
jgi:hypothetical protein